MTQLPPHGPAPCLPPLSPSPHTTPIMAEGASRSSRTSYPFPAANSARAFSLRQQRMTSRPMGAVCSRCAVRRRSGCSGSCSPVLWTWMAVIEVRMGVQGVIAGRGWDAGLSIGVGVRHERNAGSCGFYWRGREGSV